MVKWFRAQSATVKGMIVVIVLLLIGIILRWDHIKSEVTKDFRQRFETGETKTVASPVAVPAPAPDTSAQNSLQQ